MKIVKPVLIFVGIGILLNFGWHFFTDPPSTANVCYTWSKATDQFISDSSGIDGADWLAKNIKSDRDLRAINKDVLSAMKLYDTGNVISGDDPFGRHGLRQFVIDACEKAAPGSTKH
jgi:hypothetical protein